MQKRKTVQNRCRGWGGLLSIVMLFLVNAPALAQFPPLNPQRFSQINFPNGFGARGGRYTFAVTGSPISLNPFFSTNDFASRQVTQLAGITLFPAMLDGLVAEPIRLTDGMVTFEIDELASPMRVIMKLRQGLKWSDGSLIDAQDAAFTFKAYTDPRYRALSGAAALMVNGQLPTFELIDETSWAYTLPEPVNLGPYLIQLNSLTLLPQHVHQAAFDSGQLGMEGYWSAKFALANPDQIVGAGPFRLQSGVFDQEWIFERNPYYWKVDGVGTQLPYFEVVRMLVLKDHTQALLKFLEGTLDRFEPQPGDLVVLTGNANVVVESLPPAGDATANFITFNQDVGLRIGVQGVLGGGDPYLDSLRRLFRKPSFRRAISKATNRTTLSNNIFLGHAQPVFQMSGLGAFDVSGHPGSGQPLDPVFPEHFFSFDPDAANALLDGLDLPRRSGGMRVFGQSYPAAGRPVNIQLQTNQEDANRTAAVNLLKSEYERLLGIQVTVKGVSIETLLADLLGFELEGKKRFGSWQSVYLGIGGGGIDPTVAFSAMVSTDFLHFFRYSDALTPTPSDKQAQMDLLWLKQKALSSELEIDKVDGIPGLVFRSPEQRFELLKTMQLLMAEEQNLIFTNVANRLNAFYGNRLGNAQLSSYEAKNPVGSLLNFFEYGYRKSSLRSTQGRPGSPG